MPRVVVTSRRVELPPWGSPRVIELPHKARPVLLTSRHDELPLLGSPRVFELSHKARPVFLSFPGRGSPRVVKSVWAHCFERPVDRVAVVG